MKLIFNVGRLYRSIFLDKSLFITHIDQLSNEQYESLSLTDEDIEILKHYLRYVLSEREYMIIIRRFGLDGNDDRDIESVTQYVNQHTSVFVSSGRVACIEHRVLSKLRKRRDLPAILEAPSELYKTIGELKNELLELHKSPIYKRKYEIHEELRQMGDLPLKWAEQEGLWLDSSGLSDPRPIEELAFCAHTYNTLKRAGIDTVSAIAAHLKGGAWLNIRYFGPRSAKEVEEKMHLAGYKISASMFSQSASLFLKFSLLF